jgi:hypothetical protein
MTLDELEIIMDGKTDLSSYKDSTVFLGLLIIRKYLPKAGISCAEHDIVYCCGAEELVEAGLTEDDAIELRNMCWMISEESFAKFV